MQVARGKVADRPWGAALFALARRSLTGQLTVTGTDQQCCIAWQGGAIVGASSTFAADTAVRIALAHHLVTSAQVAEVARAGPTAPQDELPSIVRTAGLSPAQAAVLRRRVIEQRASRTFALDDGTYTIDDEIELSAGNDELDVRAVIYLGAHKFLSEQRLALELRQLGSYFTLDAEAFEQLYRFGFTDDERPILHALRAGTSLPELETLREIDPRTAQAVLYALASCETVTRLAVPRAPTPPAIMRAPTAPIVGRTPTPPVTGRSPTPPGSVAVARVPTVRAASPTHAAIARTSSRNLPRPGSSDDREPAVARSPSKPNVARTPSRPQVAHTQTPTQPRTITRPEERLRAAELFSRGERAFRDDMLDVARVDLAAACELSPDNVDYAVLHAWVVFCTSLDKEAVVDEVRRTLDKAARTSDQPNVARFYLGRVERLVGRDREALRHFHEVIAHDPGHAAAANEIRILEARLAANAKR